MAPIVGARPMPSVTASNAVTACRPRAASRAGIDRKNDSRVTVTRSNPYQAHRHRRPRSRHARHQGQALHQADDERVAPRRVRLVPRLARGAISITTLQAMSAPPTTQRLRNVVSIRSWNSRPTTQMGIVPMITAHPNR